MNSRTFCSRILLIIGSLAMFAGIFDPMEGAVVVLLGSAGVTLSAFLEKSPQLRYWLFILGLITVGVGELLELTAFKGIGGKSGHSIWWGLTILPYPVGWVLGLVNLVHRLVTFCRARRATIPA